VRLSEPERQIIKTTIHRHDPRAQVLLFGVGVPAISKHLENIYDSGELQREATLSILETVQQEGKREAAAL